jgi:hypothetical protein
MWQIAAAQMALSLLGRSEAQDAAEEAAEQRAAAARYEAEQMRVNAAQTVAVGTRAVIDQRRKDDQAIAAVLAGQKGAPMSPGMMSQVAALQTQAAYNSASTLYSYEDKARTMKNSANTVEYTGDLGVAAANNSSASLIGGLGDVAKFGATMYEQYGQGGPTAETGAQYAADSYNDAEYSGPQDGTWGFGD